MSPSTDRIEKQIVIKAPRAKVWRALSDAPSFGKWFGVALEGKTFEIGKRVQGKITHPGYEHLVWEVSIERMEPEQLLSWCWHPYTVDPAIDYSNEPATLVVFELQDVDGGTLLSVVESGFDAIPASRRQEAFRMNSGGWEQQMKNIDQHVAAH